MIFCFLVILRPAQTWAARLPAGLCHRPSTGRLRSASIDCPPLLEAFAYHSFGGQQRTWTASRLRPAIQPSAPAAVHVAVVRPEEQEDRLKA